MKRLHLPRPLALCCLVFMDLTAVSQVSQGYLNDTGSPAYGVTVPVENGFIDLSNGNLHLEFPIASMSQRGALNLNERLVYDSRIWMFSSFGTHGSYHWWPYNVFGASQTSGGWRFVTGGEVGSISYQTTQKSSACSGPNGDGFDTVEIDRLSWIDSSGTSHPTGAQITQEFSDCWDPRPPTYRDGSATDGSAYSVSFDSGGGPIVVDPNGTQVYPQITDRYGNYWSSDANGDLIDDTGRTPVIVTQNGNTTYYDVLAPNGPIDNNGTRVRYTVVTAPVPVETNFAQSDTYEWVSTDNPLLNPVQSITLPDGSSYQFGYDSYGELSSMVLPTGGTVNYGYANFLDSSNTQNRWLTTRKIGSNPFESFVPQVISVCTNYSTGCKEQVSHQRPNGDETVYELTLNNGAWNTGVTSYTGSSSGGQELTQVTNTNIYTNGCDTLVDCFSGNYLSSQLTTTEVFNPGGQPLYAQRQAFYNLFPTEPSEVKEWGYTTAAVSTSTPSSGTPTRDTQYVYAGFDPQSVTVFDSNGTMAGQTTYGYTTTPAQTTTGVPQHSSQNAVGPYLNTITHWLNTGTSPVTTIGMDDTGQMISLQDPNGNTSTTSYQCANSLPLNVTNALSQTTTYGYDCSSGALSSVKDPNDLASSGPGTTYSYEATAGRLQTISYPDGGPTTYSFPSPTEVDISVAASPDPAITTAEILDSYGRPYEHNQAGITSETSYDINGRAYCTTNPHGPSGAPTDGSTCVTSYDGLDRPLTQQLADGDTIQWNYSANTTTTIDPAGNQFQRTVDVFGQLTSVVEPGGFTTTYTYNVFGNPLCVDQWGAATAGQPCTSTLARSFSYDSLSRTIQAYSPESGWMCYGTTPSGALPDGTNCTPGYDSNGNLWSQTNANGILMSYSYDALNRKLSASDLTARYYYDESGHGAGIGRLTGTDGFGAGEEYYYDAMGRVTRKEIATPHLGWNWSGGPQNQIDATYDLAGNVTSLTYPDGKQITHSWDAAGRLVNVSAPATTQSAAFDYANGFVYSPGGAEQTWVLGSKIAEVSDFNNRLQLCRQRVSSALTGSQYSPLLDKQYFHASTSESLCGNAAANNGNIWSVTDALVPTLNQTFGYDALSRLTSAQSADGSYNQTYEIDPFGNMIPHNTGMYQPNFSIDPQTNRFLINGPDTHYDNAGNLFIAPGTQAYYYNFFGQLTQVNSGHLGWYTYNAERQRIENLVRDSGEWINYMYFGDQLLAELNSDGTWKDHIYANGMEVARVDSARSILHLRGTRDGADPASGVEGPVNGVPSGLVGTTLRQGDVLVLDMKQNIPTYGGLGLITNLGGTGDAVDTTTGVPLYGDSYTDGKWHHFAADLSSHAGETISYVLAGIHNSTPPTGTFDLQIANVALVHTDGTVQQIYNGQDASVTNFAPGLGGGAVNMSSGTELTPIDDPTIATTYFARDQVNTAQLEFSGSGAPVWRGEFEPFGQEIDNQISTNAFKFTGQERDPAAAGGFDYFRARHYASATGRFISPDPYDGSMDFGNPQTLNRYSYVGNMPLNFTDPTGEFDLCGASTAVYVAATGGLPGAVGGGIACGIAIAAEVTKDIFDLIGLFPHHHLTATLKKRPKVLGSPDFGVPYPGLNTGIAEALGLPDSSCEFGACGGGGFGFQSDNNGQDGGKQPQSGLAYIPGLAPAANGALQAAKAAAGKGGPPRATPPTIPRQVPPTDPELQPLTKLAVALRALGNLWGERVNYFIFVVNPCLYNAGAGIPSCHNTFPRGGGGG